MNSDNSIVKVKAQSLTGITATFTGLLALAILSSIILITDASFLTVLIFTFVIMAPVFFILLHIINRQTKDVDYIFSENVIIIHIPKKDKQILYRDISKIHWHRNGASLYILRAGKISQYSLFLGKDTATVYKYLSSLVPEKFFVSDAVVELWKRRGLI